MAATRKISQISLGERLQYLRKLRGLKQADLAKRAKLSQSTIAQIEGGRKDPSYKTLQQLAAGLEVHIAVLFATEDVHIFDMKRLRAKYKKVDDLNETLYFAIGKVVGYAKDIGFISK